MNWEESVFAEAVAHFLYAPLNPLCPRFKQLEQYIFDKYSKKPDKQKLLVFLQVFHPASFLPIKSSKSNGIMIRRTRTTNRASAIIETPLPIQRPTHFLRIAVPTPIDLRNSDNVKRFLDNRVKQINIVCGLWMPT